MAVRYIQTCRLPTPFGVFDMHGFEEPDTGKEHVALTLGDLDSDEPMLARTHSECLTGDASTACVVIAVISWKRR